MVARNVVVAGAGLVGVAAAITSSVTLFDLAEVCGISAPFAAALPIALDVGAAVGSLSWINESGTIRNWGRGIATAGLVGTIVGNSIQHAITAGKFHPSLSLILVVGACVPAMLWAVIHLVALMYLASRKHPAATQLEELPRVPVRSVDTPEPRHVEPQPVVSPPVAVPVRTVSAPVPRADSVPVVSRPASVTPPSTIESKRDRMAERITWLTTRRGTWQGDVPERPTDEVTALIAEFAISEATAKRTRREAERVAA